LVHQKIGRILEYPFSGLIVFLVLGLFVPLVIPTYWVMVVTEILIMGLFATSFNLLFGYCGLLSFGQAGFFGVGAYVTALLLSKGVGSYILICIASITATLIAAYFIGYLCVRRDEIFFAMLSLGFGMMLFTIAHNWREVTGGSDGLPLSTVPPVDLGFSKISLFHPLHGYYFVLAFVFVGLCILQVVVHSHFGLMLKASRENKERLAFSGGNVASVRLVAFLMAGGLSGLAGMLFCIFNRMATPDMLHWSFSAKPVLMTILGGAEVFWGPFVGAVIFFVLEQLVTNITENWMFVLGLLLIPIVLFFPRGILGTVLNLMKSSGRGSHGQ